MKNKIIKAMTASITGVIMFNTIQIPVMAKGNINAGVAAVFSESLTKGTNAEAGVAAVFSDSLIGETNTDESLEDVALSAEEQAAAEQAPKVQTVCGYKNLGIARVENHLNIREGAGEEYELVGKLPVDAGCEILSSEGEWYQIQSGEVTGYVKGEYLLTGGEAVKRADEIKSIAATSITQTLNARVEPNTESTIWTTIAEGEELLMLEDLGDWLKVDVDGDTCYVAREYVELSEHLPKAMTMTEINYGEGVSDVRVDMVQYACQFVGNRYVWGGTSLTDGIDCSGFTMRIYEKYGIYLPHYSRSQAECGTKIDASDAKPGDLFFYGNGNGINHVAMYIGDGQVVHASSSRTGIKISNAFYRTPICVTRLLND